MPPKVRGYNAMGKDKVFRNAIEHVHVGVGYQVLGNVNFTLSAPLYAVADDEIGGAHSAFHSELNELQLSYTSRDFKQLRFELLPLCETRALTRHHHKAIAQKLLMCLVNKENNEGLLAFLKLTVAFVRDMQERFLQAYFQAFHQVVNQCIFDKSGQLVPDAALVQHVFAVQVAWFREIHTWLPREECRVAVEECVVPLYLAQMGDSKEYIRRLAAEVLASACRQERALLPLVLESAACEASTFRSSSSTVADTSESPGAIEDSAHDRDVEDSKVDDDESSDVDVGDNEVPRATANGTVQEIDATAQAGAPSPIFDAMTHFCAEMLRGLRGSLSTNFEVTLAQIVFSCSPAAVSPSNSTIDPTDEEFRTALCEFQRVAIRRSSAGRGQPNKKKSDDNVDAVASCDDLLQRCLPQALRMLIKETEKHASSSTTSQIDMHPSYRVFCGVRALIVCHHAAQPIPTAVQAEAPRCLLWPLHVELLVAVIHADDHARRQSAVALLQPLQRSVEVLTEELTHAMASPHVSVRILGAILRLAGPLLLTLGVRTATTAPTVYAFLQRQVVQPLVDLVPRVLVSADQGPDERAACVVTVTAFLQDLLQKNRAWSLAMKTEDQSDDDDSAGDDDRDAAVGNRGSCRLQHRNSFLDQRVGIPLMARLFAWILSMSGAGPTAIQEEAAVVLLALAIESTHLSRRGASCPLHELLRCPGVSCDLSDRLSTFLLTMLERQQRHLLHCTRATDQARLHVIFNTVPVLAQCSQSSFNHTMWLSKLRNFSESCVAAAADDVRILPAVAHACRTCVYLACCVEDLAPAPSAAMFADARPAHPRKKRTEEKTGAAAKAQEAKTLASASALDVSSSAQLLESLFLRIHCLTTTLSAAQLAKDRCITIAIGYALDALESLAGGAEVKQGDEEDEDGAESGHRAVALCRRVTTYLSPTAQEAFVSVTVQSLASSSQFLRIRALKMLQLACGSFPNETPPPAAPRIAPKLPLRPTGCTEIPATFFDALIGAETADPFANGGNLDAAKAHLTPVSFDANVGRIRDPLQAKILLCSAFGLLHVKFADVWEIALAMISDLLRHEVADALGRRPLWDLVQSQARDIVFATGASETIHAEDDDDDDSDAAASQQRASLRLLESRSMYPLTFSDVQHHQEGTLVSKSFSIARFSSGGLSIMSLLSDGALCTMDEVTAALAVPPTTSVTTDAATVAKSFLGGMAAMVRHASSAHDSKVRLLEDLLFELAAVDAGLHEHVVTLRGLEDRILLCMNALSAAPSPGKADRRKAAPASSDENATLRGRLVALFETYLSNLNAKLQRAAVENLKRLGVSPFDAHAPQILPFCAASPKEAFAFASSFHVDTDIPAEKRNEYIAAVLTVALPRLSQRAKKEKQRDQAVLGRRVTSFLHCVDGPGVAQILDSAIQRLLGDLATPSTLSDSTVVKNSLSTANIAVAPSVWAQYNIIERVCCVENVRHPARRFEQTVRRLGSICKVLALLASAVGSQFEKWAFSCFVICVQSYLFTNRARHPEAWRGQGVSKSAAAATTALRKDLVACAQSLQEQFSVAIMNGIASTSREGSARFVSDFALDVCANSKLLSSRAFSVAAPTLSRSSGIHSAFLKMIVVWSENSALHPLLCLCSTIVAQHIADALSASPLGSDCVHRYSPDTVYAALRILSSTLVAADEPLDDTILRGGRAIEEKRRRSSSSTTTLGTAFLDPNLVIMFDALYRLVCRGADVSHHKVVEGHGNSAAATSGEQDNVSTVQKRDAAASGRSSAAVSAKRVMGFTLRMWGETIQAVALLADRISPASTNNNKRDTERNLLPHSQQTGATADVPTMLSQLLDISIRFVSNPQCAADEDAVITATTVVETLVAKVATIDPSTHYRRLVHLFNAVTSAPARLALCRIFQAAQAKYSVNPSAGVNAEAVSDATTAAQFEAVSRVLYAMNSFVSDECTAEDEQPKGINRNTNPAEASRLHSYDFERRYHCFHSLITFFHHNGNYGARLARDDAAPKAARDQGQQEAVSEDSLVPAARKRRRTEPGDSGAVSKGAVSTTAAAPVSSRAVRHERQYLGEEDVRIPVSRSASSLAIDCLMPIISNTMFFLRDPERAIRALASQTLFAALRYMASQPGEYPDLALAAIVRPFVLSSLRQGVVAKDPAIRLVHMESFGGLAKFYAERFPSLAALSSPHSERNFFSNIGNAQHKCRLNALALLRRASAHMHVRDLLRVFVPFLLVTIKDYAQGRRDGPSGVTEGRAKGFSESVIHTLADIATHLPWDAYYYVLKLLLNNASQHEALRLTMLRAVVHVLQSFHFLSELDRDRSAAAESSEFLYAAANDDDEGEDGAAAGGRAGASEDGGGLAMEYAAGLSRAAVSPWLSKRIISTLEDDILPQLYTYISTEKKTSGPKSSDTRARDLTAEKAVNSTQSKPKENRAITQLPVAVAIAKIVKLFPEASCKTHLEHILHEVVLKLRTKRDEHREAARKVLCAVLREVGPSYLSFVLTTLKDNFIHGYQLHVLGYTVVTLLYSMYAPASPYALLTRKETKAMAKRHDAHVNDDAMELDNDGDDGRGAAGHGDTGSLVRFDAALGQAALRECMPMLLDIFLDDYLGEIGAQKEQVELLSTIMEVKRSRALQGFVFLATYADATLAMETFVSKISFVLSPSTDILQGGASSSGRRQATLDDRAVNAKYSSGGQKNAVADIRFVNKVRFLALRVARALMTNQSLDTGTALTACHRLLDRHNKVREAKIREFEAKDGTRRIRGNWEAHANAVKLSSSEQYERNFAISHRPVRVDTDFSAPTVLASSSSAAQQKQKLRAYRGNYAKRISEAGKSFAAEDPETAVVLDTLDEFCLKFLISLLKRVLGVGKEKKFTSVPLRSAGNAPDDEDAAAAADRDALNKPPPAPTGDRNGSDEVHAQSEHRSSSGDSLDADDVEGPITDEIVEEALEGEAGADLVGSGEAQDELGEFFESADQTTVRDRRREQRNGSMTTAGHVQASFVSGHKMFLEALFPVAVEALRGEGSDAVVSASLDVLHALLSLRPPLDSVDSTGAATFALVVDFFERGGAIKQRALRVAAAVVQHKHFTLRPSDASRLAAIVRSELVEGSDFIPNSLLVLLAVMSKHALVEEIYDLMPVVTETMMHWAHAPIIRSRCVAVLAKFLTEYKLSMEKFRSHVELMVRNLPVYPTCAGRVAILELIDTLVSRLPSDVLRQEAVLLFVPLCATLCKCEWREGKEKAAEVLGHLVVNAGIRCFVPTLQQWLEGNSVSVRTTALQSLAVIIPYLRATNEPAGDVFASCAFALRSIVASAVDPEGRPSCTAATASTSKGGVTGGGKLKKATLIEEDRRSWQPTFFSLRCVEALVQVSDIITFPAVGEAFLTHLFLHLATQHAHPWVKSVALRLCATYLFTYVERMSSLAEDAGPAIANAASALPGCFSTDPSVNASVLQLESHLSKCSKFLTKVVHSVADFDVRNEKYEANGAIEDTSRQTAVRVAVYLMRLCVRLTLAILTRTPQAVHVVHQYKSLWTQLCTLAAPIFAASSNRQFVSCDGYVVRAASLCQLFGGAVSVLPSLGSSEDNNEALRTCVGRLIGVVTPAILFETVIPILVAASASSFDSLSAIGFKVIDTIKREVQARAAEFALAEVIEPNEEVPRHKKHRPETTVVSHASTNSRVIVEDVLLALAKPSEERRQSAKEKQIRKEAKVSFKRSRQ